MTRKDFNFFFNGTGLLICIIGLVLMFLLTSCKTKYVPVESVRTEYINKYLKDSIHLYDSIYVDRYMKGDTIFMFKEKYKYLYRDRLKTDTVLNIDSIQIPYPVIEYKEVNTLSSFQSFQIWCGRILLLILVAYFGIKFIRK